MIIIFNFLKRKLTKDLTEIPLFWVTFNYKDYKEKGKKGSCIINAHPNIECDNYIRKTLNDLVDYIRDNYNMEDI